MTGLVEGLYPKAKHTNAPDFVLSKLSANVEQFGKWFDAWRAANPGEEWLNIDILESKAGKQYAKVDDWKPNSDAKPAAKPVVQPATPEFEDDDIPF